MLLVSVAMANEPVTEPEPERRVIYRQKTEIDFEALEIEAQLIKPTGALLLERRAAHFNPLIKLCLEFARRNLHFECAAKTFCLGLGNFHRFNHPYLGSRAQEMRAGAL